MSHVSGWLLEHDHPQLMIVRYEEMHQDIIKNLNAILDFAGLTVSEADLIKAVDALQFDQMQARNSEFKSSAKISLATTAPTIRQGKVGSWQKELDDECLEILKAKYGQVMQKVGYDVGSRVA